jgi:hypothetical protein
MIEGAPRRSVYIPHWIFASGLWCRLNKVELRVLGALCEHRNAKGTCWPSLDRIGEVAGLHRSGTYLGIQGLKRKGILTVVSGKGRRKTNTYFIPEKGTNSGTDDGREKVLKPGRKGYGIRDGKGTKTGPVTRNELYQLTGAPRSVAIREGTLRERINGTVVAIPQPPTGAPA